MRKFLVLAGAIVLMPSSAFAQNSLDHPSPTQCQLIKLAVAHYGYAAARQHALETYGPESVKFGDQCLATRTRWSRKHDASGER